MYKQIKRVLRVLLTLAAVMFLFSACSTIKSEEETTSVTNTQTDFYDVCILFGKTKNVRIPDVDLLREELLKLERTKKSYSVIVLDGKPDIIELKDTVSFPKRLFNPNKNNQNVLNGHLRDIMSLMPKEEEIDILEGLESSRKALNLYENKKLVIFSSGISTSGELNFAKNPDLIEELPSKIVKKLKSSKSLPDLSDIEIVWYGFGDVADDQEELCNINYYRLKNIWIEILRNCGVSNPENVFVDSLPIAMSENEYIVDGEYLKVSKVDFPNIISIEEDEIGFEKDKATFIDEKTAIKALEYYAECMKNADGLFYVVGSTATIKDYEYCYDLGKRRAKAVKNILCDVYDIPSENLKIFSMGNINLGGNYEWREYDLNEDGTLNEDIAPKNRRVFIVEAESEDGKRFIEQWKARKTD